MMLAIPILLLLALLVSAGLAASSRPVSGGFVEWLKNQAARIPVFGGLSIDQIVKLDRYITSKLGTHYRAIEGAGVRWFGDLSHYVDVVGYWSLYWPIALFHEVTHLTTVVFPNAINARTKPLSIRIDAVEAQAKATAGVAHSIPKVAKAHDRVKPVTRIERVAMPHAGEWDWIHEHFGSLKKAIAGVAAAAATEGLLHFPAYPIPWKSHLKGIRARLKRIEYLLGATGAAVLVARAIGGVTGNCVKKGAIGKVARRLCGLSSNALNDILGLLVDTFFIVNICEAIHLMEQGLGLISGPLKAFTAGADKMFVDCGYTLPGKITVPQLYTATAAQVAAGK